MTKISFTSEYFIIDGKNSSDIGVDGCYLIRTDSEISYPFMGSKNIVSDKVRYKDIPYFYTVEKQPIEFDLKISLLDKEFNNDVLFDLGNIFAQDKFVEFRSADFWGKVFYVICTEIELITFGSFKGWLNIHIINCAPFCFSEKFVHTIDLTNETLPYTFEIDAKFNVQNVKYGNYYFPELEFELVNSSIAVFDDTETIDDTYLLDDTHTFDTNYDFSVFFSYLFDLEPIPNSTSFTLTNMSDGGRAFVFTGLQELENISVNNELKQITSNTGLYRLNNFNKLWFRLVRGRNLLQIYERCILQIKCQYPLYL